MNCLIPWQPNVYSREGAAFITNVHLDLVNFKFYLLQFLHAMNSNYNNSQHYQNEILKKLNRRISCLLSTLNIRLWIATKPPNVLKFKWTLAPTFGDFAFRNFIFLLSQLRNAFPLTYRSKVKTDETDWFVKEQSSPKAKKTVHSIMCFYVFLRHLI